jgi:hypothetical protein
MESTHDLTAARSFLLGATFIRTEKYAIITLNIFGAIGKQLRCAVDQAPGICAPLFHITHFFP